MGGFVAGLVAGFWRVIFGRLYEAEKAGRKAGLRSQRSPATSYWAENLPDPERLEAEERARRGE